MEKTLTVTIEDALISPESFAMLSGAGIVKGTGAANEAAGKKVYVHTVYDLVVEGTTELYAKLSHETRNGDILCVTKEAPVYATTLDSAGAPKAFLSAISQAEIKVGTTYDTAADVTVSDRGVINIGGTDDIFFKIAVSGDLAEYPDTAVVAGDTVRIDCYTVHGAGAQELEISADEFAGYYYIEADTLFREEATGQDLPAQFVIPRGKIQSNFTFTMANSGDPSTFQFTVDAFPAYTKFNKTKKVLATLQILDPTDAKHNYANKDVIGHKNRTADDDAYFTGLYDKSVFDQIVTSTTVDDQAAADEVMAMPTATDANKIAALQAYSALTETQKALVSILFKDAIGVATTEEATIADIAKRIKNLPETPTDAQVAAILKDFAILSDNQEDAVLGLLTDEEKAKLGF